MKQSANRRIYQGVIQPMSFPPLPQNWVSDWETFPSADGQLQLYSVFHHSENWQGPRTLVVLHGLGEHGGRYLHFPHYLQNVVDGVYCLDHRGHGRSEGIRGHVESFDLFVSDLVLALGRLEESLVKRFGRAEIHLFAHSMGGLIALKTLLSHPKLPLQSVAISAPLLKIALEVPALKRAAASVMVRLWGSLQMTSEVDAQDLSHDLSVVHAYSQDRLVHSKVTPQLFTQLLTAMESSMNSSQGELPYPVQFHIPLEDKVVSSEAAIEFYRNIKSRDKTLKTYPHFFHEAFNELKKEEPFSDLLNWIKAHSTES